MSRGLRGRQPDRPHRRFMGPAWHQLLRLIARLRQAQAQPGEVQIRPSSFLNSNGVGKFLECNFDRSRRCRTLFEVKLKGALRILLSGSKRSSADRQGNRIRRFPDADRFPSFVRCDGLTRKGSKRLRSANRRCFVLKSRIRHVSKPIPWLRHA